MLAKYQEWIKNQNSDVFGACKARTEEMVAAFPELKRVRGHYYDIVWGERMHWWCVDPDGNIIDPTARQFPTKGKGAYVPWKEGAEEPTGICPNCGEYCYEGTTCCSEKCHKGCFLNYYNS